VLRRRWRWAVGPMLVAVGLGALFSVITPPTYRATASVYFSLQNGQTASDLVQGSTYAQGQVASFAALATTPAVLGPVVERLGLDLTPAQLAGRVTADAPVDTVLVELAATGPTRSDAVEVAGAVADQLSSTVEALAPRNAEDETTVRATIVAPASSPGAPVSPDLVLDLLVGLLVGLVVGVIAAFLRELLDNRVRDAEVLSSVTDLPLLGSLAEDDEGGPRRVVVEVAPHDPRSEFFRQMRTNLQFLAVPSGEGRQRPLQVLMVTSALPGEGKSTVAANLAAALAETEQGVLLIDADLRRPSQSEILGIESGVGLSTVLVGRVALEDVVQDWGRSGLTVLPSGAVPPNPAEMLTSPAMRHLLERAREDYAYVVLDCPPLLPVADAAILSKLVDGALVVANTRSLRRPQLQEALTSLAQVGARVLGVALNRVERDTDAYSYQSAAPAAQGFASRRGSTKPSSDEGGVPPRPVLVTEPRKVAAR